MTLANRSQAVLDISEVEKETLLRYFPHGLLAIDLETTGLSALCDEIIEIAAIKLTSDGRWQQFYSLVKPRKEISANSTKIHQITNAMVKNAANLPEVLKNFQDFWKIHPIVAHNALFDLSFIIQNFHIHKISLPCVEVYDSIKISRAIATEKNHLIEGAPSNHKLSTLAKFFNFPLEHHLAMKDAEASMKVLAQCLLYSHIEKPLKKAQAFKTWSPSKDIVETLPSHLKILEQMTRDQQQIFIEYAGGTHGSEARPVIPIALIPQPKGPVLYARCLKSNFHKSFKINKIKKVMTKTFP